MKMNVTLKDVIEAIETVCDDNGQEDIIRQFLKTATRKERNTIRFHLYKGGPVIGEAMYDVLRMFKIAAKEEDDPHDV
jgi:hypothetical protein